MKITYYWTWAALNPNVDTTHFQISSWENILHVDAGWWMSLTQRVLRKEIAMPKYIFMTHCHSDHLLWLAHLIRIIKDNYMTILASSQMKNKIHDMMYMIGKWEFYDTKIEKWNIDFIEVNEWEKISIYDRELTPINLYSKKTEQFWFDLKTSDKHIVFFWDEAVWVLERDDLSKYEWCDRLLCEAFCVNETVDLMKPYDKAHITAEDAWAIWTRLQANNIIISHVAESYWTPREEQLKQVMKEVSIKYEWNVCVPSDWEIIHLM